MSTNRSTVARGALIGSGLVAAVLIAGCQGGSSAGGSPSSSLSVSPTTATPTTAPSSSSSASPTSTPAGNQGGSGSNCKAAQLKLSLGQAGASAGHFHLTLEFTNTGTSSCVMYGWPGVSYVTGNSGSQVGAPAVRTGNQGPSVTLAPGAVASSAVTATDVSVFNASSCQPTSVGGFRVYPPGDTASLFVARSGEGCAGNPPSPQLRVETVKAGAGSA